MVFEPRRILVAVPCYGCMVSQHTAQSLLNLASSTHGDTYDIVFMGNESLIPRARNLFAHMVMHGPWDRLFFVDADIGFDAADLVRCAESRWHVCAALYPMKDPTAYARGAQLARRRPGMELHDLIPASAKYAWNPAGSEVRVYAKRYVSVRHAGTGFMCIAKEVLERMAPLCGSFAPPSGGWTKLHPDVSPDFSTADMVDFFDLRPDPDTREYLSEDYSFCRRLHDLKLPVMVDIDVTLSHTGSIPLHGHFLTWLRTHSE